ncbi:MAG: RNA-directed DNA polymerase [Chitinophagaceae bacterium]
MFSKTRITETWRTIVRQQLRTLDLTDLFDHYDFNYNIEERSASIRNEILNGSYKVGQPLIYRIEKKFGICRHLVIPQPSDSLVLQVLVEYVASQILAKQPSKNAFYSRDKHNMAFPHEIEEYGLTFRQQWKNLQKKIYNFNEGKKYIVVTDLSNYYDSIDIKELRKVFTSYAQIDEVLIDLLFRLIEEISWKPDYLPYSGRGLPTTNIEGIRLLAHSFLFELDEVVKQKSKNNFTRWMDDIVIGVDSRSDATNTISIVSDMLKSRGLALNLSKTNIYDDKDGYFNFQIEANRFIDSIETLKKEDVGFKKASSDLYKSFKKHFKDQRAKYWDKIAKRHITTLWKFGNMQLLKDLSDIYLKYPGLRTNLLIYLTKVGYKSKSAENVLSILQDIEVFDDISLYQLCKLVTEWEVPNNIQAKDFLGEFEKHILRISFTEKMPSHFYSVLWFKAKYNHPEELLNFISRYENIWQTDTFLRRQVTAIFGRLFITDKDRVKKYLRSQVSSGVINTVMLAAQLGQFSRREKLDTKLNSYLFPLKKQSPYPLPKFLVLCSVLNSEKIRKDEGVQKKIKSQISDPYYLKWLEANFSRHTPTTCYL